MHNFVLFAAHYAPRVADDWLSSQRDASAVLLVPLAQSQDGVCAMVSLRDDEVDEISRTGQLTTSKMGKNDHVRKVNMKVAGTLGNYLSQRVNA